MYDFIITLFSKSPLPLLVCGLFFCLLPHPAAAAAVNLAELAKDPRWLKLGYYKNNGGHLLSEVSSPEFFLSPEGNASPLKELSSTIESMRLPLTTQAADAHAICKFPARFLWLKSIGELTLDLDPFRDCPSLVAWLKPSNLESASLVYVTGYLGNPASTFGHILLKLANAGDTLSRDALDSAVNFGAIVGDDENDFLYTLYGLFGGYQAGFSAKNVYEENHVYLSRELRDMWQYQLALTPSQLQLLGARVWELLGRKFRYYFIDHNCAYHMTELLEFVLDAELQNENATWNIPASLFYAVDQIPNLVDSRELLPSSQRELMNLFNQLQPGQQAVIFDHINGRPNDYRQLNPIQRIEVANVMIHYYQYKTIDDPKKQAHYQQRKQDWLLIRLRDPVRPIQAQPSDHGLLPPSMGHKPSLTQFAYQNLEAGDQGLLLSLSSAYHDRLNLQLGQAEDTEFIAMDTSLLLSNDTIELDQFIFARATKFATAQNEMFDSWGLSWSVELGYQNANSVRRSNGVFLKGGLGKAIKTNNLLFFSMAEAIVSEHGQTDSDWSVSLRSGVYFNFCERCSGMLALDYSLTESDQFEPRLEFNQRVSLKRDMELRLELLIEDGALIASTVSLYYFW